MTLPDIHFQRPAPVLTKAEIARNVAALRYPEGWAAADDVALVEGLFQHKGLGLIAAHMGRQLYEVQARFLELRGAATGGAVVFALDAQTALLAVVRDRAKRLA